MPQIHLLVLIHGMWGHPGHLAELDRIIRETHPDVEDGTTLEVLLAEANREDSTYDGIDWGGERVAQEVLDKVKQLEDEGKTVTKFSVTGYSLGGLVSRYLVGILHQRKFFENVAPINFNTLATPHLGLVKYPSVVSSVFSSLGSKLMSRTGEQFYCIDQWSNTGRPLLDVMSDPNRIFYQALASFKNIRIYANAVNDVTVPYVTSAIEVDDPFVGGESGGLDIDFDETYQPLIKQYTPPSSSVARVPDPIVFSPDWFRKKRRPILPPALQLPFPLNVVLYLLLPILVPVGISVALVRFTLASRSSRARIKLLEQDSESKLIHRLRELEKDVEDAVADIIEDTNPTSLAVGSSHTDSKLETATKPRKDHPIVSPLQRTMASSLNTIPGLKKELTYIPFVRNSHAIIVCRDVKRFETHRMGEGVVRHWATTFIA